MLLYVLRAMGGEEKRGGFAAAEQRYPGDGGMTQPHPFEASEAREEHRGQTPPGESVVHRAPCVSPHPLVQRPRLLTRLDQAVRWPVTMVVAPAGYGKSTLVAQWMVRTELPVRWISPGVAENAVDRFLVRLRSAILQGAPQPDSTPTIPGLIADACALTTDIVLVLDGYHRIANDEIHRVLDALIHAHPPHLHLILISRVPLPLRLGRLRAYGHAQAITPDDLAFTQDEVTQLLAKREGEAPAHDRVTQLLERTKGWVAGVMLAATPDGRSPGAGGDDAPGSASSADLDAYIREEVLNRLPEQLREFVLGTAGLDAMSADLCDAVLGTANSAVLLAELRRRSLLTRDAGDPDGALRYLPLVSESFARIAQIQIPQELRKQRLERASAWYEAHDTYERALECAILAGDEDRAVRLMQSLGRELADRGRAVSLLALLRQLPDRVILTNDEFAYWRVFALLNIGRVIEARGIFDDVEARWRESGDAAARGRWHACAQMFASIEGDFDEMLRQAQCALKVLPESCVVERMHALTYVFEVNGHRGHDDVMIAAFAEARRVRDRLPAEQWWWTQQAEPLMANVQALRGDLQAAFQLHQEVPESKVGDSVRIGGRPAYLQACLALERNDLAAARRFFDLFAGGRLSEQAEPYFWTPEALMTMAQVTAAEGNLHDAISQVRHVIHQARAMGRQGDVVRAEAKLADLWIAQGNLVLARHWARQADFSRVTWSRFFGTVDPRIVLARLLLVEHDPQGALDIVQQVIAGAEALNRRAELVRAHAHSAAARAALGDEAGAVADLDRAVRYGTRGRFVR